ncbi:MAG: tetratricopeptide repeat protein [Candidatus Heimdallarchaeota archaeon]|nr:tetratricopeptide repeat protein [Candidatus Heimdallarchaeota archaeon]
MTQKEKAKRSFILDLTSEARSLIHHGKFEEALVCYDKILAEYPDELVIEYEKAIAFFEFGDFPAALELLDRILARDPQNINALYAKGAILNNLKKFQQALSFFDQVIQLDPEFQSVWTAKGFALLGLQEHEKALDCFQTVKEQKQDKELLIGKGHAFRHLSQYKKARNCYQQVLRRDPYAAGALFGLGVLALINNDLKRARDYLYKSVAQDEANLEAWKQLAEVYRRLDDSKREAIVREKIAQLQK